MKRMTTSSLILACVLVAAGSVNAQQTGGPGGRSRPPKPPIDTTLDADGDGTISAAELADAAAALAALDADGDGRLTLQECLPPRPDADGAPGAGAQRPQPPAGGAARDGRRPPQPPTFAALDADGDGVLAASEISGAATALATLDRDGDGALAPDEYRPPRPGGPGLSQDGGAR